MKEISPQRKILNPYTNLKGYNIKARIEKYIKKIAYIHTELYNSEGELCSEGEVKYFIYPEQHAREKLYFPESDRFFEK